MGQQKKSCSLELTDPVLLKEAGNEAYKKENLDEALACYTKGLEISSADLDKAVLLKNRAAVYLKTKNYEQVVKDCSAALEISTNDPKALFRRSQAQEALGNIEQAYADAKLVHKIDPKTPGMEAILLRLHSQVQSKINTMSTTKNKVETMSNLVFDVEADTEKREKAADNMIVLSKENAGAECVYNQDVVPKIVKIMKVEKNQKIRLSLVRVLGFLAKSKMERAKAILKEAGSPFFLNALNTKDEDSITAVTYVIQAILDSLSRLDLSEKWKDKRKEKKRMTVEERKNMRADEEARAEIIKENKLELTSIMNTICFNTTSRTITGEARDALVNLIMKNCQYDQLNWAEHMLETDSYQRLMEVASELNTEEYKYESNMEITDSTKTITGVTFGLLYEQMYDDGRRARLTAEIDKFTQEMLMDPGLESKVRLVSAITTLLQNAPDLGNSQLKEGVLQMMLVMARSEEYIQQLVASEAIIAAANKKKDATAIVVQGLDILKTLYKSKNDHIKVRALVGLCKLGASGGHDASLRPFADGSSTKLAEACRRFLINPGKDDDLRRWAAEGLSFLTLDAEVKERLIEDEAAIKALIELGKTGKQNVAYGVVSTLVNLTNSYDKQEINPEMLELAKFAKHHIPEDHELDDQDFVDKRIYTLGQFGITSALVALSKTESKNMKELICRVLCAVCNHQELRGLVVQQGGSKVLVQMALDGTDKGMRTAAQALSRIAITQDPAIAFPGQRSCDVIRPICQLLDVECESLENFEALMALGNLASLNESVRSRILKDSNAIQGIENYMFEEHLLIRRAAVQCWTNLCVSDLQVKRCEGKNDKVKYCVLMCGDDSDPQVVKAAAGALAMLTEASAKVCEKVFDSKQWEDCLLSVLANEDYDVTLRGVVIINNMVQVGGTVANNIFETQIMDVLQALVLKANLDLGNAQPHSTLQKIKTICEKSLKKAHELGLIRTTAEAVKAEEEAPEETIEPWMKAPAPGGNKS
ncbi:protein unc-45 homolog B [Eurytemora carolleeae]|uniref:protein unc-45 homolog B n=1 Tax=Eurytemora carolleeae TaxID=1294199 RepID=UPI000C78AAA1|nr:protein unc-45 homolog B [Eurytemora carolleeae]|eukprot:XP_023336334.1 protein unc-45 homolog B-like [Eurytemora affinis]